MSELFIICIQPENTFTNEGNETLYWDGEKWNPDKNKVQHLNSEEVESLRYNHRAYKPTVETVL
jgi:hypothetical protein